MKTCKDCGIELDADAHFNRERCEPCATKRTKKRNYAAHLKWREEKPDQAKVALRRTRINSNARLKKETLSHYGKDGKAVCCWPKCRVTDLDMLSIDHIADNGKTHRANGATSGIGFYGYLRSHDWPEGYQTLCANHQIKKEILRRRTKANQI